jgi:glucuronokinase
MIIREYAHPRAGLIGNPSDGYFGKTIAFAFTNFRAGVTLYETPELEILPNTRDQSHFHGIGGLAEDVRRYGYYGGIRLLKATIKRFHDYCRERGIRLHDRNFTIRYESDIPHLVGLAGSSAIITACLRALMKYYGVQIPKPTQPNLILSVETDELGISAGLQDRVAQVYQGVVYMDFNREGMDRRGHGQYEQIPAGLLPPLYIAYRPELSEGSEVLHNTLRSRYLRGDADVLEAIRFWADLAEQARARLLAGEGGRIGDLLDANFDRRAKVCAISQGNMNMVRTARSVGVSAKFTGSGGAILGAYDGEDTYRTLREAMRGIGVEVIQPAIAPPTGEDGIQ